MNIAQRTSFAAVAAFLGLVAAGCSSSGGGTATIDKHDVEAKAKAALTKSVGVAPKSITCPDDLDATKGASEKCTLTAPNGDTVPVTATVTSVDGGRYHLSFKVGTHVTHH